MWERNGIAAACAVNRLPGCALRPDRPQKKESEFCVRRIRAVRPAERLTEKENTMKIRTIKIRAKRAIGILVALVMAAALLPAMTETAEAVDDANDANRLLTHLRDNFPDGTACLSSGLCQTFVNAAFWYVYDTPQVDCCATMAWQNYCQSTSQDNIPLGACVYFDAPHIDAYLDTDACQQYEGHVGIYVGDGTVVNLIGGYVCWNKLSFLLDPSNGFGFTWRGWGWHGNLELVSCDHDYKTVKKSDGSYTAICAVCQEEYTLPALNTTVAGEYTVTRQSGGALCSAPYSNARLNTDAAKLTEGQKLNIVGSVVNAYKNTWYKTEGGYWVYGGDVMPAKPAAPAWVKLIWKNQAAGQAYVQFAVVPGATSYEVQYDHCTGDWSGQTDYSPGNAHLVNDPVNGNTITLWKADSAIQATVTGCAR